MAAGSAPHACASCRCAVGLPRASDGHTVIPACVASETVLIRRWMRYSRTSAPVGMSGAADTSYRRWDALADKGIEGAGAVRRVGCW